MRNGWTIWGPSTWQGGRSTSWYVMVWPMAPLFRYYCTEVWDSRYSQSHYQRRDLPQAPWNLAEDQLLTNEECFSTAGSRRLNIGTESASFWFFKLLVSAPPSSTNSLLLRRLELGRFSADSKNLKLYYWLKICMNQYVCFECFHVFWMFHLTGVLGKSRICVKVKRLGGADCIYMSFLPICLRGAAGNKSKGVESAGSNFHLKPLN